MESPAKARQAPASVFEAELSARSLQRCRRESCAELRPTSRLASSPKNGSLEAGQGALVSLSASLQHRLASASARSPSLQFEYQNRNSTPQAGPRHSSATVEFLLRARRPESPAARETSERLPALELKGYHTSRQKRKSDNIKVLKQRIRLLEAQEERTIHSKTKQRSQDILVAACRASDSSSRPSIRLHANLKARNELDPLFENLRSGFGSFRTQLCSDMSAQKQQRIAGQDLDALSKTQLRFKEIHQQITKLKKRRMHGPKDCAESAPKHGNHKPSLRTGLSNPEQLPQSFSDSANKTPETGCTPLLRLPPTQNRDSSQTCFRAGPSSERPTLEEALVASNVQARQRSLSGQTGLTEAEHSDSMAGSVVNSSATNRKRGLSDNRRKPASSLALQQGLLDGDQQTQTTQLFVHTRNTPPRKPRLQKLDTAATWNGLVERQNPVTQRAFKHRRAKKLNLMMNIDLRKLRGDLGCSEAEQKLDSEVMPAAGSEGVPSEVQSARQKASDKLASGSNSWSKVSLNNRPKPAHPPSTRLQFGESVLKPQSGQTTTPFTPHQADSRKTLQVKPVSLWPGCLHSPNHSASQRPEEKSTENESDSPQHRHNTTSDAKPGRTESQSKPQPQTPNSNLIPHLAVAELSGGTKHHGTQAADSLAKKASHRNSGFGSDFDSPISNAETRPNATEIDHKSLYESFSLMYRTIFSTHKLASAAKGLKKKQQARLKASTEAGRPGTGQDAAERDAQHSESSADASSSRDASRSPSVRSHKTKASDARSTAGLAASTPKPQILVLQPSRKPTPALALPLQDFGSRDRIVQQIEVDLCDSSSESSSFRKPKRSSSKSSFSGFNGFYGRHKAH